MLNLLNRVTVKWGLPDPIHEDYAKTVATITEQSVSSNCFPVTCLEETFVLLQSKLSNCVWSSPMKQDNKGHVTFFVARSSKFLPQA